MRADLYMKLALLFIVLPLLWIILSSVILVSIGLANTFTNFFYALYVGSQRMIIMGIVVGGIKAVFGMRYAYNECRKTSIFEWSSEQAKRQAAKEFWSGVGYVCTFLFLMVIVFPGATTLFLDLSLTENLLMMLGAGAIYAVAAVIIGIIDLGTSLLIELIFGKY